MDIMLDNNGDLFLDEKGDIALKDSVAQAIKIRLKWFEGEWRWNPTEGLPYLTELLVKNPNVSNFQMRLRSKIFEVEDVTDVKDISIDYTTLSREGTIRFTAMTDMERIRDEVNIDWLITE